MQRIGLQEAIGALRTELTRSIQAAQGEDIRFRVGEISLQFQIEIERTVEAGGGIKFWVVDVGSKGSRTSTVTHTVTIPLSPLDSDGSPILTGGTP